MDKELIEKLYGTRFLMSITDTKEEFEAMIDRLAHNKFTPNDFLVVTTALVIARRICSK